MVRHNNQLPDNLPQLQNLIKRDPDSYKDDFRQQYQHFLSSLEVFALDPSEENKSLDELVIFIAQVSSPIEKFFVFGKYIKTEYCRSHNAIQRNAQSSHNTWWIC